MAVSWFQLIRTIPEIRKVIQAIGESKDWYKSDSILYQIIKVSTTVLSGIGILAYSAVNDSDIQTISINLAVIIPSVLTLCDGLAAVWFRLRTNTAIKGTSLANKAETIKTEIVLDSIDNIILSKKDSDISIGIK